MKMLLLMTEALLIIATLQDHTAAAEEQVYPLDMALNSVDDQFDGCTEEMGKKVEEYYLEKEKSGTLNFKTAWDAGVKNAVKPSPGDALKSNHLIAIYVYTDRTVYADFNNAVRSGKQHYENRSYGWCSLHFLLTEAIQILKGRQNKCYETYRGTNVKINDKNVLNKVVRLGSFASSSLFKNIAKNRGSESCFEITTCKGADIAEYSKLPREKEVLIPPYETFKVTEVKKKEMEQDLWCKTVFVLKSTGIRSDLNCTLYNKPLKVLKNIG